MFELLILPSPGCHKSLLMISSQFSFKLKSFPVFQR
jgi:hypothetical protein